MVVFHQVVIAFFLAFELGAFMFHRMSWTVMIVVLALQSYEIALLTDKRKKRFFVYIFVADLIEKLWQKLKIRKLKRSAN